VGNLGLDQFGNLSRSRLVILPFTYSTSDAVLPAAPRGLR